MVCTTRLAVYKKWWLSQRPVLEKWEQQYACETDGIKQETSRVRFSSKLESFYEPRKKTPEALFWTLFCCVLFAFCLLTVFSTKSVCDSFDTRIRTWGKQS